MDILKPQLKEQRAYQVISWEGKGASLWRRTFCLEDYMHFGRSSVYFYVSLGVFCQGEERQFKSFRSAPTHTAHKLHITTATVASLFAYKVLSYIF